MPATIAASGSETVRPVATRVAAAMLFAATPAVAAEFATLASFTSAPSSPVLTRDLDGRPLVIAAVPDRVTLVHFFASWCEPCEDELPALKRYVAAHADRVRLIGVDVAEPASRAKTFAARLGITALVALDEDKAVANAFQVRGLPATGALSPSGGGALAAAGPLDWSAPETTETIAALGR